MSDDTENTVRFAWWNVGGLARYDNARAGEARWPSSQEEAQVQLARVGGALSELSDPVVPSLVALCEVTLDAAKDLAAQCFPGYHVFSLDTKPRKRHHLALLYNSRLQFQKPDFLEIPYAPKDCRPMLFIDFLTGRHRLRFYTCHWPAFENPTSQRTREDASSHLNRSIYNYLHEGGNEYRHAIVVGDLNEEPFSSAMQDRLHAYRERSRAQQREHYSDVSSARVRLYNCSWRLLGEKHPHTGQQKPGPAGTYFWEEKQSWHTIDHLLATGSLLGSTLPRLDEQAIEVFSGPSLFLNEGRPQRFLWSGGKVRGVSDHLPIVGRVSLPLELNHDNV